MNSKYVAVVLVPVACFLGGCAAKRATKTAGVVLVLNRAPGGTLRECLEAYVSQGLGVQQALKECNRQMGRLDDLPSYGGLGGLVPGRRGPQQSSDLTAACSSGGVDPRLGYTLLNGTELRGSTRPATEQERQTLGLESYQRMIEWTPEQERLIQQDLDARADQAFAAFLKTPEMKERQQATQELKALLGRPENDPERQAAQKAYDEAKKKSEATREYQEWEDAQNQATDGPPRVTPGGISQPNPMAENFCARVAGRIAECNDNRWQRADCQRILARMNRCVDPLIAYTGPDSASTCSVQEVDPETVQKVVTLACQMKTKPAPGEDPCSPQKVEGVMYRYWYRLDANGSPQVCTDPRAMVSPEQCTGTFTLVQFGAKDFDQLINEAHEKFGGPIVIIPQPQNPPGPPRPGPEGGPPH